MKLVLQIALFILSIHCQAASIDGKVVDVADGDTVTVLDLSNTQHKIRLAGIDAPEKSQPFGRRSKESMSELVLGKVVIVETTKKDKYGRSVGTVKVDGLDANLEQIKRGLAWHYKEFEREQSVVDRKEYSAAEVTARAARLGLWADPDPVPPWKFRHRFNELRNAHRSEDPVSRKP